MKRSLLSFLILVSSYTNAQSVDNLNIQESSGRPVYVTGYDLNNKYITLNFKVTDSMNVCWYGSGENIPFIIDDNSKKSSLVGLDNVTYCPERMSMSSGDKFFVKFVAPSDNAKTFSLVEGECALNYKEGCWRFENIPLNHQSKKSEYSVTKKDFFYIENNKLTKADLKDYSKGQLRLLRNYFFAKKGFTFKEGSDLDTFFKQFSWYSPTEVTSTDIYENQLTEQEKNNVSLILAMEKGESAEQVSENKEKSNIQNTETTPKSTVTVNEESKSSESNTVKKVASIDTELSLARKDGHYGFINSNGEIIIPFEYIRAKPFMKNGLALVKKRGGKYGFINKKGKFVIQPQYDKAVSFSENGLAAVRKEGGWGFINSKGEEVIPLQYSWADSFSENGLAPVSKDGKKAFINSKEEIIIPLKYDYVRSFSKNGLAPIAKDGKWGFINSKGEVVIPLQYDKAYSFSENGLARVQTGYNKWALINTKGESVVSLECDKIYSSSADNLARVRNTFRQWGAINSKGDIVIPFEYSYLAPFSVVGLAEAKKGGSLGFINTKGEFFYGLVPYSDKNTLSVVHNEQGKYGFVNNKGEVVVPLEYDKVYPFSEDGLASVEKNGKWDMVDKKGMSIIQNAKLNTFVKKYISNLLDQLNYNFNVLVYDNNSNVLSDEKLKDRLLKNDFTLELSGSCLSNVDLKSETLELLVASVIKKCGKQELPTYDKFKDKELKTSKFQKEINQYLSALSESEKACYSVNKKLERVKYFKNLNEAKNMAKNIKPCNNLATKLLELNFELPAIPTRLAKRQNKVVNIDENNMNLFSKLCKKQPQCAKNF
ncbi:MULTISPECIES: WG repeat-containing protein [Pasteurellaceae]|uniref:WG repeat-containing protein n=1 Tax=Pasteurella atlantica TaxID=2827233 RepID=A0AAW8CND4_9PAST|nr:WG repeat-containing protein [Pasteurella atlantica]MBR0572921.1 WG repeat-containing protein [Pasteurella atlantica]MDP8038952.1 WG repeat-containing protein [Pasteurella atlantica]MDP8040939.1 WG repeat-containing protein [Pasteurella atlantica]MDP8043075.1 WG repeat-containing protein [Pasteurella atlantica]MDP8045161.1 WG repeat-containing protein [Pasteurella atlantica]